MAITEDMALFLADFGVTAVFGAAEASVLLDMPDAEVLDGIAISSDPYITYAAADLPSLARNSSITVNGTSYKVREILTLDDGALKRATLAVA